MNAADTQLTDSTPQIGRDAVRIAFKNLYNGWLITPLCAVATVIFLWRDTGTSPLILWFVATLLLAAFRLVIHMKFNAVRNEEFDFALWKRVFLVTVAVSGALWGLAALLIFPVNSLSNQVFLIFVIGGLAIGVGVPYSSIRHGAMAFALPSFLPFLLRIILIGDPLHYGMAAILLVLFFSSYLSARNAHALVSESLRLRYENIGLLNGLREAREQQARDIVELKKAKEKAEDATKLKDKFVSLVAHDLKTPIASVSGHLNLLTGDKKTPLHPDHLKQVRFVLRTAESLGTMIDELLNINMLQTGKVRPQRSFVYPRLIMSGIIESLDGLAMEKGIKLENTIPAETRIHADGGMLLQVFQNLVTNAIKFTAGGVITAFVPDGRPNAVAVSDTGTGIPPAILRDVFRHEIRTTTSGTAGERGTGLGLPLCHDIMEAHGGTLTAESKEGRGSVFIAEFPRAAPSVLIVEDEEDWLILLRHELDKMNGFINTRSARNGVEALEIIKNHPPDVIISDIMMPVMTGLELLESVRRNFSTRNTPFIIITSSDERELRETALRMGANDFLIKPFAPDEFVPRIGRFVR